ALDAELLEAAVVDVGIAGDHLRLERGHAPREGAADVAEADDADGLAVDRPGPGPHRAHAPGAPIDLAIERDYLAVPRQEEPERVVGDLADPEVRNVHDDHTQLGGRRHVDHVVADARPHDSLQPFERAHDPTADRRVAAH